MKRYQLSLLCGFIYEDESVNDHAYGIGPDVRRGNVSNNWCCRNCSVSTADFEMAEL